MKIDHTALYVADLEGAKTFFEKYFDATANNEYVNSTTGFRSYFMTFTTGARLEIMTRPDLSGSIKSTMEPGLNHLAFSVGSRQQVDALTRRLSDDGYHVVSGPRTTGDGYYESCVAVFEGNLIELTI